MMAVPEVKIFAVFGRRASQDMDLTVGAGAILSKYRVCVVVETVEFFLGCLAPDIEPILPVRGIIECLCLRVREAQVFGPETASEGIHGGRLRACFLKDDNVGFAVADISAEH